MATDREDNRIVAITAEAVDSFRSHGRRGRGRDKPDPPSGDDGYEKSGIDVMGLLQRNPAAAIVEFQ